MSAGLSAACATCDFELVATGRDDAELVAMATELVREPSKARPGSRLVLGDRTVTLSRDTLTDHAAWNGNTVDAVLDDRTQIDGFLFRD